MTHIHRAMSIDEASIVLDTLIEVCHRMEKFRNRDAKMTLDMALRESLTSMMLPT
jgi:hypothetical protein